MMTAIPLTEPVSQRSCPTEPSPGLPDWACLRRPDEEGDARIAELLAGHVAAGDPVGDEDAADPTLRIQALGEMFETRLRVVHDALEQAGAVEAMACLEDALEAKVLAEDLAQRMVDRRLGALVGLQEALAGLRRVDSSAAILQVAVRELAHACGFDRANLFKVHDGRMVMEAAYWQGDPGGAQEMLEYGRAHAPRLDHMLLETEMIRRRAPCLVLDAPNDPRVPRDLADFARTRSYVAAPIMPAGKVIGFVHADCLYSGRRCDALDRDLVWAFAEGFGYAFERTVMVERLRRQRDRARTALLSTVEIIDDIAEDELRLTRAETGDAISSRTAAGRLIQPEVPIEAALTRREIEVVRLMATGMTNKAIADELVVTVGTVKAHVKHILKKFRAANRAEAVSRYMRSARERELRAFTALGGPHG